MKFRNKVASISLYLSVLMVFFHTLTPLKGCAQELSSDNLAVVAAEIVHSLGALCVPFFFVISGYLFFRTFKIEDYCKKVDSRWNTLFLPYIIWNILATVQCIIGEYLCILPRSGRSLTNWILATINSDCSVYWYIKYLLYFAVLSPCIYYFIKTPKRAFFTFTLIASFSAYCILSGRLKIPIPVSANSIQNFCYNIEYFLVGAIAVLHLRDVVERPPKWFKYPAWMLVAAFITVRILNFGENFAVTQWFFIIAVISIWFALDSFKFENANRFVGLSFFIYCSHTLLYFPILWIYPKLSNIPEMQFLINCSVPIIITLLCIGIGETMRRYMPHTFSIINGGRG